MSWYSPEITLLFVTIFGMAIWFFHERSFEPLIGFIGSLVALTMILSALWQQSLTNAQEASISFIIIASFASGLLILRQKGLRYPTIVIGLLTSIGIIIVVVSMLLTNSQSKLSVTINQPPIIHDLSRTPQSVYVGQTITLTVIASDADGDPLQYVWSAHRGKVPESANPGSVIQYVAPTSAGIDIIRVVVSDGKGGTATKETTVAVLSN